MNNDIPKKIGHGLAYLQDAIDRMVTFGFKSLRNYAKEPPKKIENPVKKAALEVSAFLGEMGTEYYEKYSEIKRERDQEKKASSAPKRKTGKKSS